MNCPTCQWWLTEESVPLALWGQPLVPNVLSLGGMGEVPTYRHVQAHHQVTTAHTLKVLPEWIIPPSTPGVPQPKGPQHSIRLAACYSNHHFHQLWNDHILLASHLPHCQHTMVTRHGIPLVSTHLSHHQEKPTTHKWHLVTSHAP